MTDTTSEATGRIFISYRRQDSAYPAGWLYDRLAERFGPGQIFKDVDSIELGDDFVETITNAVGSCDILLALIGQEWLDVASSDGARRLDDPDDFVRLEIEAALERKVLLIPILVDGAIMPRSDQLPSSIAPLVRRQALELSPNRFRADTDRLLDVITRTLADLQDGQEPPAVQSAKESERPPERTSPVPRRMMLAAAAAVAVIAGGIATAMTMGEDDPRTPTSVIEDPTPNSEATEPPQLGGSGAPIVLAHRGGDEEFAWQTIPAFEHAAKIGAEIETDVRWTKDGVAVLLHDEGTTPGMECEGGNHLVKDTNWPVLRDDCRSSATASTNGKQYSIPTFADAVSALAKIPGAEIYAEVKVEQTGRQTRHFVETLKNARMTDRAVVTSFLPDELDKIRAQADEQGVDLRTMLFVSGKRVPAADLAAQDLWAVAIKADVISKAYVGELNDAGMKVMMWIVNTPKLWKQADSVGADLVLTDKPAEYGKWAEVN
ncbi:MAG: glycerophosphodiester phosphodiesterase family protein [Aeromicrobium sp.]